MDAPPPKTRWVRTIVWTLVVLFVLLLLVPLLDLAIRFAVLLLFGWVPYLIEVLPRVSFNAEIAFNATVALVLAVAGLHRVLVWWGCTRSSESVRWRFASTLKVAAMVLLLFATSIAATGIVHQVGWLVRAPNLTYNASRALTSRENSNLRAVMMATRLYEEDHNRLPGNLEELVPDYLENYSLLFSTLDRQEPPEWILYFPDNQGDDPGAIIVLAGPHATTGSKRVVAFRDGSVRVVKESEFQEALHQQAPPPTGPASPR